MPFHVIGMAVADFGCVSQLLVEQWLYVRLQVLWALDPSDGRVSDCTGCEFSCLAMVVCQIANVVGSRAERRLFVRFHWLEVLVLSDGGLSGYSACGLLC